MYKLNETWWNEFHLISSPRHFHFLQFKRYSMFRMEHPSPNEI